ncbi:MAG: ribosome biogenesis factor YjgA [Candidatus Azotimanducaceae bacterium WSBS_2022_MAG_OTU7]
MNKPKNTDSELEPSKSQKKRAMDALKELGDRLTGLSPDHLAKVADDDIRHAVEAARKITKGNARKRQIQYIAKLLSRIDADPIKNIIETLDASSAAYVQKFHQLESWRESLVDGDSEALSEILDTFPNADRQKLRHLVRKASDEREAGQETTHFRRLFQFLKALTEE